MYGLVKFTDLTCFPLGLEINFGCLFVVLRNLLTYSKHKASGLLKRGTTSKHCLSLIKFRKTISVLTFSIINQSRYFMQHYVFNASYIFHSEKKQW